MSSLSGKPKSCFDKSVCCVCTQSIWKGIQLSPILVALLILSACIGCIINTSVYSNPSLIGSQTETVGFYLHITSFVLALILSSYLGRYISGLQNASDKDFEKRFGPDTCGPHYYYCVLGYFLGALYAFFTLVHFAAIAGQNDHGFNVTIINQYSKGIVMYYISFVIIWFHITVFKSFIPNFCNSLNIDSYKCYLELDDKMILENEKYSWFVRYFTNYGFYERNKDKYNYGIWTSFSLLIFFCISVSIMNFSYAVYYNDIFYHNFMIIFSTIMTSLAIIIQCLIFMASYKRYGLPDNSNALWSNAAWPWIICISIWILCGFIVAHFYIPYDNSWKIDDKYKETSMIRNIFFIVQGVPVILFLVVLLGIGIYFLRYLPVCCYECCKPLKDEINEAKNKVQGYQSQDYDIVITDSDIPLTE